MKLDQMKAGTMGLSMGMSMVMFAGCGTKDAGKGDGEGKDIILKGATQIGYPPFAYIDENGNHTGFDYELMKLIGERLDGYDVEVAAKIVFAKNKDGEALKALIDPVIREMKEDGSLSKLSEKWTGGDYVLK